MCLCVRIYTHTHTCIYLYTHEHIHTHTHVSSRWRDDTWRCALVILTWRMCVVAQYTGYTEMFLGLKGLYPDIVTDESVFRSRVGRILYEARKAGSVIDVPWSQAWSMYHGHRRDRCTMVTGVIDVPWSQINPTWPEKFNELFLSEAIYTKVHAHTRAHS